MKKYFMGVLIVSILTLALFSGMSAYAFESPWVADLSQARLNDDGTVKIGYEIDKNTEGTTMKLSAGSSTGVYANYNEDDDSITVYNKGEVHLTPYFVKEDTVVGFKLKPVDGTALNIQPKYGGLNEDGTKGSSGWGYSSPMYVKSGNYMFRQRGSGAVTQKKIIPGEWVEFTLAFDFDLVTNDSGTVTKTGMVDIYMNNKYLYTYPMPLTYTASDAAYTVQRLDYILLSGFNGDSIKDVYAYAGAKKDTAPDSAFNAEYVDGTMWFYDDFDTDTAGVDAISNSNTQYGADVKEITLADFPEMGNVLEMTVNVNNTVTKADYPRICTNAYYRNYGENAVFEADYCFADFNYQIELLRYKFFNSNTGTIDWMGKNAERRFYVTTEGKLKAGTEVTDVQLKTNTWYHMKVEMNDADNRENVTYTFTGPDVNYTASFDYVQSGIAGVGYWQIVLPSVANLEAAEVTSTTMYVDNIRHYSVDKVYDIDVADVLIIDGESIADAAIGGTESIDISALIENNTSAEAEATIVVAQYSSDNTLEAVSPIKTTLASGMNNVIGTVALDAEATSLKLMVIDNTDNIRPYSKSIDLTK